MTSATASVQDVADTARWAAALRARETRHPQALFQDPLAERLAGARGWQIADSLSNETQATSWVLRTHLFDGLIAREIDAGADLVLNLGAGLDARPYRMDLPPSLQWVEVDGEEILEYKENQLASERPACRLERLAFDLRDVGRRSALFQDLGRRASRILVVTEGVLIYFHAEEVAALAHDLHCCSPIEHWILELVSPQVVETMERTAGRRFFTADASFRFGPAEGPQFFSRHGWQAEQVHGVLQAAVRLGRTPFDPRLADRLPGWQAGVPLAFPWMGVCFLGRQGGLEARGARAAIPRPCTAELDGD
jgi:methyltransferase (TIGR00027 family)